jgi:hypothetical protein
VCFVKSGDLPARQHWAVTWELISLAVYEEPIPGGTVQSPWCVCRHRFVYGVAGRLQSRAATLRHQRCGAGVVHDLQHWRHVHC